MTTNQLNLKEKNGDTRLTRAISVFGLTQSAIAEHLTQFKQLFPLVKLDFQIKFPEIHVILHAGARDTDPSKESLGNAARWVYRKLENYAFSDTGEPMQQVVGALLHKKNASLAMAESCTGGLIANWVTDVPGSSDYFLLSAVTYSNQAKIKILGVPAETLERHGAVSEQTARAMARGAKDIVGATYGLSTSGIAGPGGGTDDKPVGTVCIGLATPLSVSGHRFTIAGHHRRMNKHVFALTALNLLRQELL